MLLTWLGATFCLLIAEGERILDGSLHPEEDMADLDDDVLEFPSCGIGMESPQCGKSMQCDPCIEIHAGLAPRQGCTCTSQGWYRWFKSPLSTHSLPSTIFYWRPRSQTPCWKST